MTYALRAADGRWVEIVGGFTAGDVQYPANWPELATPGECAAIGVAEIVETPRPEGVQIVGSALDDVDGVPTRRWLTEAASIPQSVSPRQLRLALLGAGGRLLEQIEAFVTSSAAPAAARIAWEYATEFRRDDPMLVEMATHLSPPLDPEQIDALFTAAAAIR